MDGAWQVTGLVFVCLAHVDQHVGCVDGLFGLVHRNFLDPGFGGGNQVVGGFHVGSL